MPFDQANMGYIPAIAIKEMGAGRQVEVVGSVYVNIRTRDDYEKHRRDLIGLFGEIRGWKGNVAMVATRSLSDCPMWVREMVDEHVWDRPEMFRWQVPKEQR